MNPVFLPRLGLTVCAFAGLPFASHAQATPPAPPPVARSPANAADEAVTLTEFRVNASTRVDDYIASEAVSGTRTGAKILELPYNVQVLTKEFMEDFQVFDEYNYKAFQYVPNYAPDNNGRLRGFQPQELRDGFVAAGATPSAITNTQQIEVIMGPQSTLYGHVTPGGVVNYVSKQPRQKPFTELTAARGSDEFQRYGLETTGPLIRDKLFYLLNATYIFNGSNMQHYYSNIFLYSGTLTYKFTPATSVTVAWERQQQAQNEGTALPDLLVGSRQSGTNPLNRTGGVNHGPYRPLAGFNQFGPNQRRLRNFESLNARAEHRFNSVWAARLSLQRYRRDLDDRKWSSGLSYIPETKRLNSRSPAYQAQEDKTDAALADLVARFGTGSINHHLLFAADYTHNEYANEQWALPSSDILPNSQRFLDPFNPDWTNIDYSLLTRKSSWSTRDITYRGATATYRVYGFNDRLIALTGLRSETVDSKVVNPLSPAIRGDGRERVLGYSFGVNYKISGDRVLAYANYSRSFDTSTTVDQGVNQVQRATRGQGPEAGFKGLFFDGRIAYTVSTFRIEQDDRPIVNPAYNASLAGTGVRQYLTQGAVLMRGSELSLSARVTDAFTLIGNAGYLDAQTTSAPGSPAIVGDTLIYIPAKTASFAARYTFRHGWLKGIRTGVSGTYTGSRYTDLGTASVLRNSVPSIRLFNTFVSYEWRQAAVRHSFNVNVQNALDKFYLNAANKLGQGRNLRVTYQLTF
jgi:iron complex outermembrane receptor protein